jgi:hypothetical protein
MKENRKKYSPITSLNLIKELEIHKNKKKTKLKKNLNSPLHCINKIKLN